MVQKKPKEALESVEIVSLAASPTDKNTLKSIALNKEDVTTFYSIGRAELLYMIKNLDYGNYDQAVKVKKIILQDSKLKQALDARLYNLFDSKFICTSKKKSDQKDCEIINSVLAQYEQDLKKTYADFILLGHGIAQFVWEKIDGRLIPQIYYYDPFGLRYDNIADINFLITSSEQISESDKEQRIKELEASNGYSYQLYQKNLDVEQISNNTIKWFSLEQGHQGFQSGLIRSICWDWLDKQTATADYTEWSNKQAGIIYKLFIPNQTNGEKNQSLASMVRQVKKHSVVALPRGENDSSSYDLQTIEPQNQNVYQAFVDRITRADTNYSIVLLGNNLSTEVVSGSLASSITHREKELFIAKSDKQFLTAQLNKQFVEAWKSVNNPSFQGEITIAENKAEDIQLKLDILSNISMVNTALKEQGYKIDLGKLLGELEIDFVEMEEEGTNDTIQPE